MTVTSRTQVGIVGAGPAGLLLSHLLALRGIDSIVVENRSRAYCEARQRAGLLEAGTVELLRKVGLGTRLDAGARIEFEVSDTEVGALDSDQPVLRFTDSAGTRHEVTCDTIAGCDGFHGICRDSMPAGLIQVAERAYP